MITAKLDNFLIQVYQEKHDIIVEAKEVTNEAQIYAKKINLSEAQQLTSYDFPNVEDFFICLQKGLESTSKGDLKLLLDPKKKEVTMTARGFEADKEEKVKFEICLEALLPIGIGACSDSTDCKSLCEGVNCNIGAFEPIKEVEPEPEPVTAMDKIGNVFKNFIGKVVSICSVEDIKPRRPPQESNVRRYRPAAARNRAQQGQQGQRTHPKAHYSGLYD